MSLRTRLVAAATVVAVSTALPVPHAVAAPEELATPGIPVAAATSEEPASDQPAAEQPATKDGYVTWNMKRSFWKHLEGPLAKAEFTTTGGAYKSDDSFVFPIDTDGSKIGADGSGTLKLDGTATVRAYKGLGKDGAWGLDVTYSNLRVEFKNNKATLYADFTMSGRGGQGQGRFVEDQGTNMAMVDFILPGAIKPGTDFKAQNRSTVARDGLEKSLLNYKNGQKLDDGYVSVVVYKNAELPQVDTTPSGSSQTQKIVAIVLGVITAIAAILGVAAFAMPNIQF